MIFKHCSVNVTQGNSWRCRSIFYREQNASKSEINAHFILRVE